MKKLIWLILLLPILLTGTKQKEQWHYELPFRAFDLNDSIPTINQFGQIRNGIIVDAIVDACNADPSGVKLTKEQLDYIRSIVGGMYVIGTWQKCATVYGMVGGNAFKHKFNWKDPRDLDVSFRLVFNGTITHSANGMQGNGSTGWANTNIIANSLSLTNNHFSFYRNLNQTRNARSYPLAAFTQTGTACFALEDRGLSLGTVPMNGEQEVGGFPPSNYPTISYKFILSTRTSNIKKLIVNNNIVNTTDATSTSTFLPPISIGLFVRNTDGGTSFFSDCRMSFVSIGAGLTDKQAIQQSQIVTYSQTILGRQ
jgi:hypothetical protein